MQEFDFSSLVTALLVAMNMYGDTPWYVTALASVFAVVVAKMLFGGTGKNVVNPAIAGRVFATVSFGAALGGTMTLKPAIGAVAGKAVTGGTSLGLLLGTEGVKGSLNAVDLLLGTGVAGTIGETCAAALLLGGIYLVVRGVLNFRWPLVYMAVVGVVSFVMNYFTNEALDVSVIWNSILTGGVVLGAVFMATDYVTTPNTKLGNYIYFVFLGLLTAVLRYACKCEVVSYVILLGNLVVPLIDKFTSHKPFGYAKPEKAVKEEE